MVSVAGFRGDPVRERMWQNVREMAGGHFQAGGHFISAISTKGSLVRRLAEIKWPPRRKCPPSAIFMPFCLTFYDFGRHELTRVGSSG